MVPVYKALEKRWNHWDDLENDPRWNADSFQFSPTSPQMPRAGGLSNNKYNRLSTCGSVSGNSGSSRSGSFRNKCALPRAEDQVEIKMPPAYADIFASGAGFICPQLQCEHGPLSKETSVQQSRTQGAWALPQPTTLTLQVHRSQLPNHPRWWFKWRLPHPPGR